MRRLVLKYFTLYKKWHINWFFWKLGEWDGVGFGGLGTSLAATRVKQGQYGQMMVECSFMNYYIPVAVGSNPVAVAVGSSPVST